VGRLLGERQRRLAVGRLLGEQQRSLAVGRLLGDQQRRLAVGRSIGEQQILGVTGATTPVLRNILVCVRGICPRELSKRWPRSPPSQQKIA
jgi:hypothetical protein